MTDNKLKNLDSILKEMNSFVVAFSGGVDSTFLLHRASRLKNIKYTAVTIRTTYIPKREIEEAVEFCKENKIRHAVVDLPFPEGIRENPVERCYKCKKQLFGFLKEYAKKNKFDFIADGTNSDDRGDYRPGLQALEEMGIRSPLMEAGFTKQEIRDISKMNGLPTWDKPAYACLLTRIPYDTVVTDSDLRKIEEAEQYLFEKGFYGARVRLHGDIARIECMPGYMMKIVNDPNREQLIGQLKKIGFRFISLDLEGYRTGSLNPDKKDL
jgi:pyridinium-3,5-biscarboxylic acid mononucleotide sulfurtransferase